MFGMSLSFFKEACMLVPEGGFSVSKREWVILGGGGGGVFIQCMDGDVDGMSSLHQW